MRIMMCTNTYLPHVGGVAKSVAAFAQEYKKCGHDVLVIAPEFDGAPEDEENVIRIPAIQNFNGSDFSACLPIPLFLMDEVKQFEPDIVHSHHPFLLGTYAYKTGMALNIPVVFTHHTMYERYTHYVPGDCELMKTYAIQLSKGYCNLCSGVIAPSESIKAILRKRDVTVPIEAIPTGVDLEAFKHPDGDRFRNAHGIDDSSYVIGHVGRLAPEKNLEFLATSVANFLAGNPGTFLVVGSGPSTETIKRIFDASGISDKLVLTGSLGGQDLIDAYAAMDVFAFASMTETQGMVVLEAMATATPVIALDAPGVRDIVDSTNGVLLDDESTEAFVAELTRLAYLVDVRHDLGAQALKTATDNSLEHCANRALEFYSRTLTNYKLSHVEDEQTLLSVIKLLESEWRVWSNRAASAVEAVETSISR